jgi:hypothetical protein
MDNGTFKDLVSDVAGIAMYIASDGYVEVINSTFVDLT